MRRALGSIAEHPLGAHIERAEIHARAIAEQGRRSFAHDATPGKPAREVSLTAFVTLRRWRLREGRAEADLLRLVRDDFQAHYRALSDAVRLGLLKIDGTRSYFAVQYWRSRADCEAATQAESYRDWWRSYEPLLAQWDELMEFEEEYSSEDLLS